MEVGSQRTTVEGRDDAAAGGGIERLLVEPIAAGADKKCVSWNRTRWQAGLITRQSMDMSILWYAISSLAILMRVVVHRVEYQTRTWAMESSTLGGGLGI